MARISDPGTTNLSAGDLLAQCQFLVEMKRGWGGSWQRKTYFEFLSCTDCAAPAIGIASFKLVYGMLTREDRQEWQQEYDEDTLDAYIRVVRHSPASDKVIWTGLIISEILTAGGGENPNGIQRIEAVGLPQVLNRDTITGSTVKGGSGSVVAVDTIYDFNKRGVSKGHLERLPAPLGNRSSAKHTDGAYTFGADGDLWTAYDQVEELLARHVPKNGPVFVLGGQADVLKQFHPVTERRGQTPWQVLTKLISPNRGLGVVPLVDDARVTLFVYTTLDAELTLGGVTIPASQEQFNISLDDTIDLDRPQLVFTDATRYEEVEVRGQPVLSCFSLSFPDSSLAIGWNPARASEMKTGAFGTDGYDGWTEGRKADANDAYRADDKFNEVYSKFILPKTWNGKVGDGLGTASNPALLSYNEGGNLVPSASAPFCPLDKKFESFVPLRDGVDYSAAPPDESGVVESAETTYRRPAALCWHAASSRWYYVDKPDNEETDAAAANFGIYPRDLAVKIGASPTYRFAKNHFEDAEGYNEDVVFDYESLIVTVALRTDTVLKATHRKAALDPSSEMIRRKVIEMPECEYWYLSPHTFVGVKSDGQLAFNSAGLVLRDDSSRIKEVLAAAVAWYDKPRAGLTLRYRRSDPGIALGTLIRGVTTGQARRESNSVVSSIGWQNGPQPTLTYQTQWGELDFGGMGRI